MATFAVLDNESNVMNIIVAESKEDAESVTEKTCIFVEEGTTIGSHWDGSKFISPEPAEETPAE